MFNTLQKKVESKSMPCRIRMDTIQIKEEMGGKGTVKTEDREVLSDLQ